LISLVLGVTLLVYIFFPQVLPPPVLNLISREKPQLGYQSPNPDFQKNWFEVQRWTNTTPKESVFLLLTQVQDFNLYSERVAVKFRQAGGNLIFSPEFAQTYISQMEALGFDFEEMEKKNNVTDQENHLYQTLTETQINQFAQKYQIDYLVIGSQRALIFPLVFQNKHFSVYQMNVIPFEK
jgi:hypothetical protein